jgi:DNA-binding NtrC family response regulator
MKIKVLLADDETAFRVTFAQVLTEEGISVDAVEDGLQAIDAARRTVYDVAILDIQMPGADGIKALQEIVKIRPQTRVIMITAYGTVDMAVEAIKLGACDYVMKPVLFDDILIKIRQQCQYRRLQEENLDMKKELGSKFDISQIIGNSAPMRKIFETLLKVANTKSNILITGESGTGKELVARAIHQLSKGFPGRFVAINCSAIPEGLIESELFGHKKGSFTSATENKKGLFEVAQRGTLFLDEIGYMPLGCQVKLLRAVEERRILPVGETESIATDLRVIAATNKVLQNEIKLGLFREDLYYRLNVVGIHLPPLRDRKEDIPILVNHFMERFNREMGKSCKAISDTALQLLLNHEWRGNIRELQNVIERAVIFSEGETLGASDMGLGEVSELESRWIENLQDAVRDFEKQHILRVLRKYQGDKTATAKALAVGVSTLYRKMSELSITAEAETGNQI